MKLGTKLGRPRARNKKRQRPIVLKKPGKIKKSAAIFPPTATAPGNISELRERAVAASLKAILAKAERGKPLSAAELRQLEQADQREEAGGTEPTEATADIQCDSHEQVAELLGITKRTLSNWRRDGVNIAAESPPYSFRACCQEIKGARKLRGCKPKPGPAHAVWSSVLAEGGDGGADPNAPAHDDPIDWTTEKERQETLRIMAARQVIEQEMSIQRGALVPREAIKETMDDLRILVINTLTTVMLVPGDMGLSMDDRARWADALQVWISRARAAIAKGARGLADTLKQNESSQPPTEDRP